MFKKFKSYIPTSVSEPIPPKTIYEDDLNVDQDLSETTSVSINETCSTLIQLETNSEAEKENRFTENSKNTSESSRTSRFPKRSISEISKTFEEFQEIQDPFEIVAGFAKDLIDKNGRYPTAWKPHMLLPDTGAVVKAVFPDDIVGVLPTGNNSYLAGTYLYSSGYLQKSTKNVLLQISVGSHVQLYGADLILQVTGVFKPKGAQAFLRLSDPQSKRILPKILFKSVTNHLPDIDPEILAAYLAKIKELEDAQTVQESTTVIKAPLPSTDGSAKIELFKELSASKTKLEVKYKELKKKNQILVEENTKQKEQLIEARVQLKMEQKVHEAYKEGQTSSSSSK